MLDFEKLNELCKDVEQYYEEVIKQVSHAVENSRSIAEKYQYNNLNHNLNSIIAVYRENFHGETLVKGIESWEESELSFTRILKRMQAGGQSMDRSRQMERVLKETVTAIPRIEPLREDYNSNPEVPDEAYSQIKDIFLASRNVVGELKVIDFDDNILNPGAEALENVIEAAFEGFFKAAENILKHLDEDLRKSEQLEKNRGFDMASAAAGASTKYSGLNSKSSGSGVSAIPGGSGMAAGGSGAASKRIVKTSVQEKKVWLALASRMFKRPEETKPIKEFYEQLHTSVAASKLGILEEKRLIEAAICFWEKIPTAYIIKNPIGDKDGMVEAMKPRKTPEEKGILLESYSQLDKFWPIPPVDMEEFPCSAMVCELANRINEIFGEVTDPPVVRTLFSAKEMRQLSKYADEIYNGEAPWEGVIDLFKFLYEGADPTADSNRRRQWFMRLWRLIKDGYNSDALDATDDGKKRCGTSPAGYIRENLDPAWRACDDWMFGGDTSQVAKILLTLDFANTHYTIPDISEFGYMKKLVSVLVRDFIKPNRDAKGQDWCDQLACEVAKITGDTLIKTREATERFLNDGDGVKALTGHLLRLSDVIEDGCDLGNIPFEEIEKEYNARRKNGDEADKDAAGTKPTPAVKRNNKRLVQEMKRLRMAGPIDYLEFEKIREAIDEWRRGHKKFANASAYVNEVVGCTNISTTYIGLKDEDKLKILNQTIGAQGNLNLIKVVLIFGNALLKGSQWARQKAYEKNHSKITEGEKKKIDRALHSMAKAYCRENETVSSNDENNWRLVFNAMVDFEYAKIKWCKSCKLKSSMKNPYIDELYYPFIRIQQENSVTNISRQALETVMLYFIYMPYKRSAKREWEGSGQSEIKIKAMVAYAYYCIAACMLGDQPSPMSVSEAKKIFDLLMKYQREQLESFGKQGNYLAEMKLLDEDLSALKTMEIQEIRMAKLPQ